MPIYQVIELQSVSKSEDDQCSSWVIDKLHKTGVFVDVGNDQKELCKKLKELKFINTIDFRKISLSSIDKDIIDVREKKSLKPLCRLEIARWLSH